MSDRLINEILREDKAKQRHQNIVDTICAVAFCVTLLAGIFVFSWLAVSP